jgi:uncharacterized membrane protein
MNKILGSLVLIALFSFLLINWKVSLVIYLLGLTITTTYYFSKSRSDIFWCLIFALEWPFTLLDVMFS